MPSELESTLDVALAVAAAFERVGIDYFLGGSLASSLQGEPRATNDIDFVVDLRAGQIGPLAAALGSEFDLDEAALLDAVATRGSWNIFHLPMVTKIDLFVLGNAPFDRSEFNRRQRLTVRPGGALFVKSAEDSILRKLLWFLDGGRVSERQWRDVVEILRVSRAGLDVAYLDSWAGSLALTSELAQAREDAARP